MNINQVIEKLKVQYPGKKIVLNSQKNLTEILCEIDPTSLHPEYSIAIAVIDESLPHHHEKTTETYEIISGKLKLFIDGQEHILKTGEKIIVKPGQKHFAKGTETWVKVTSRPGWKASDHIL